MAASTLNDSTLTQNPQHQPYFPPQTFDTNMSAFKPTSSRGLFTPTLEAVHQPSDILSAKLDTKLDALLEHNLTTDENFKTLRNDMTSIKQDLESIPALKQENTKLKQHLAVAIGKINRLEDKEECNLQKIINIEQYGFSKDVVIYNLPESNPESTIQLTSNIYNLFHKNMQIPLANIFHPRNPGGEIRIDNCFRIGKKNPAYPRPIVLSLLTQLGKKFIIDRTYTKNLSKSKIRITHRYQSEIRERRDTQMTTFRALKQERKDNGEKINLINDKIMVNNVQYQDNNFELNPLPASTSLSIHYDYIQHSQEHTKEESYFQGHCAITKDIPQATAAKNCILQNPDLSVCDHLIYAYRIRDQQGTVHSGFSDDREINGGKILLELLKEQKKTEHFLCITRLKKGFNIGKSRFELIKKAASEVLDLPEKPEEVEEFYLRLT